MNRKQQNVKTGSEDERKQNTMVLKETAKTWKTMRAEEDQNGKDETAERMKIARSTGREPLPRSKNRENKIRRRGNCT